MRCKKHLGDLSSGVGVCASCLRDRLFALMEAQAQAQLRRDCRKSDSHQPLPLSFPRSVSPYISRRKTAADWNHRSLYSTPQVGPTASLPAGVKKTKSYGGGRFSAMVLGLFRSKSDKHLDSTTVSVESCSASSWWFPNMIPGRRKKQIRSFSVDESSIAAQLKARRNWERGMSPARYSDEEDEHCRGGSSGYSSESSQGWKQTPQRTPAAARRGGGSGVLGLSRNVSGLAFCLSPLVRASPNRQWNQMGIPPEALIAGESRIPAKRHLLFCKNRSRKLADFGRYNSRH